VFAPAEPIAEPVKEVACVTTLPWPVFAPIDPAAELSTGMAADSRGATEGIQAAPSPPSGSDADRTAIASLEDGSPVPSWADSLSSPVIEAEHTALDKVQFDSSSSRGRSSSAACWGQAVQLTSEAMHAWMKVLTGPALVEVTAR